MRKQGIHTASIPRFIDALQAKGRYSFTRREAGEATGESDTVLKLSLWRLARKRRLRLIREGFYAIIPLEYAGSGVLPPEWFIADLMKFQGLPYYVGLLSAASIHGASHLQAQEFQVVVPEPVRAITAGNVSIRFFAKAGLTDSAVVEVNTPTGRMRVSDPAVTAIDLVAYARRVGGLDRILTILQELGENLTAPMVLEAARAERQMAIVQRLGYLLERAGHGGVLGPLSEWVGRRNPRETPLDPSSPHSGCPRNARWKVNQNAEVEGEL